MKHLFEYLLSKSKTKVIDDFKEDSSIEDIKNWCKHNKVKCYDSNSFKTSDVHKHKFSCCIEKSYNTIKFNFIPNDDLHQIIERDYEGQWVFFSFSQNPAIPNVPITNIKFDTVLEIIHKIMEDDSEPINFKDFI